VVTIPASLPVGTFHRVVVSDALGPDLVAGVADSVRAGS
jgi:hypothetical protein